MGILDVFRRKQAEEERDGIYPFSLNAYIDQYMQYAGNAYPLLNQTLTGSGTESIGNDFQSYVAGAYKSNGVIFACMAVRMRLFSQIRFQFRRTRFGVPGDLFGNRDLAILEKPWTGGTTADLLARAIQDADIAGNFFAIRRGTTLRRLRPDWVSIVIGSNTDAQMDAWDIEADVIGYLYHPGGRTSGKDPIPLDRADVAHFAPNPDPIATFRGMSWLTPIIREIQADTAMTEHKRRFMDNGATPNMIVKREDTVDDATFNAWVKQFEQRHAGVENAYKTLYLASGADATVVGANFQQIDFKTTQGAGETRIAAAAGVPPSIVGLSEGLQGSSLNAGNFSAARRTLADVTLAHLWANFCGSMSNIITVPGNAELWYDDKHIPFMREDQKDVAAIEQTKAVTIRQLLEAGFTSASAIKSVLADGDWSLLEHTGLFSVQLQAPGSIKMPVGEVPGEVPVNPGPAKPETVPSGDVQPAKPPKAPTKTPPSNGKNPAGIGS